MMRIKLPESMLHATSMPDIAASLKNIPELIPTMSRRDSSLPNIDITCDSEEENEMIEKKMNKMEMNSPRKSGEAEGWKKHSSHRFLVPLTRCRIKRPNDAIPYLFVLAVNSLLKEELYDY